MDGLPFVLLVIFLILANIFAIKWYKDRDFPLWGSGLLLAIAGVILGIISAIIMVRYNHSLGTTGEGGAIAGAMLGMIIVGNGLIYFVTGLALKIGKLFTKKKTQE